MIKKTLADLITRIQNKSKSKKKNGTSAPHNDDHDADDASSNHPELIFSPDSPTLVPSVSAASTTALPRSSGSRPTTPTGNSESFRTSPLSSPLPSPPFSDRPCSWSLHHPDPPLLVRSPLHQICSELNQTKEKLPKVLGAASLDEIEVLVSMQLNILEKCVGKGKGRGIRGLGYGPRKECNSSSESGKSSASMTEQNVVKLTATVQRLLRHLRHIKAQLATVECYDVYDNEDDDDDVYDNENDDVNMYGDGEGEEDEGTD
ncbi:hypothetical protein ACLB2K_013976 [Fragaria x ananassa]